MLNLRRLKKFNFPLHEILYGFQLVMLVLESSRFLGGYSFSTYAQRGEGGLHVEVRSQKRPCFARVL